MRLIEPENPSNDARLYAFDEASPQIGDANDPQPSPGKRERWALIVMLLFLDSLLRLVTQHIGGSWDQESSPTAQVAWTAVYIYALVGLIIERKRFMKFLVPSIPIILLIVLVLASTFWSTFPDLTAKRAFGLFGTSLIGYYFACRFRLADFLQSFAIANAIAAGLSIFTILFLHNIGIMQNEYAGAWQGIYGQKNILANSMVVGIMNTFLLLVASTGRRRLWYGGLLLVFSILLVGSRSATSMLTAAVMVALMGTILLLRSRRFAVATAATLVLIVGLVAIAIPLFGLDMDSALGLLGRDSTLTGRTDIWPYAIEAIQDRPWLGWGYKAFWMDPGPVMKYITSDWLPFHAHNGFLELSIDVGYIGTSLFVIASLLGMWMGVRLILSDRNPLLVWPFATCVWYILSNITEANIATYNAFPWVIFLSAFAFATSPTKRKPPKSFGYGTVEGP